MVGLKRRATVERIAGQPGTHGGGSRVRICRHECCRPGSAGASRWPGYWLSAAPLWLLDEPFTNLDAAGSELVSALLDDSRGARRLGRGGGASRPRSDLAHPAPGISRVIGAGEAFVLVLRRELALSFRRPDQLLQPLVFFLIVTTLFPLGLSVQLSLLRDMAPGVLWVAALLSSLLSLDALFKSDAEDGTLEQLALSGQGLQLIVIAKTLAHWLVSGAALVLVSPLVGTALAIPETAFGTMMAELGPGYVDLELARGHRRGPDGGIEARQRAAVADRAAAGHAAADFRRGQRPSAPVRERARPVRCICWRRCACSPARWRRLRRRRHCVSRSNNREHYVDLVLQAGLAPVRVSRRRGAERPG